MNIFLNLIKNIKSFIFTHNIWSIIFVVLIIFIGYKFLGSKTTTETRYVTSTVVKGDVVMSVSGSGQVEASNTIDLKSKSSGNISSINVKPGVFVKKGQTLFTVDAEVPQKAIRDAELNLQIAKNDLVNSHSDYENIKTSQELSLKNLFLALNSEVVAVPAENNVNTNIVSLSGSYNSSLQGRYTMDTYACQGIVCINYSGLESGSFSIEIGVPKPLGTRGLYVVFSSLPRSQEKWYVDVPSPTTSSYLSNIRSYTEKELSAKQAIEAASQIVVAKELAVTQKQNILIDAKNLLSDYYVLAPFDGTVATITGKLGDIASTTLGTIITKQKIASITLNEVDVSKISLGQKATLTFDAVDGLSIAGEVVEIDGVGTVTSGVVSYKVKISFSTDDVRVKPGMSVSSAIITKIAQNVLTVPNSAIKAKNSVSYVEMFDTALRTPILGVQGSTSITPPRQQTVEVGVSNDTTTEIVSGLKEGDIVVSKTITNTVANTTSSVPSLLGSGRGSIGGGALRNATGR